MKRLQHAFTLVELLVVIAIISLLAALLFPVFARVRAAARATVCLSNVRQIGMALQMYATDYDEVTPTLVWLQDSGSGNPMLDWTAALAPYVKSRACLYCPDRTKTDCTYYPTRDRCFGYGYNWGPLETFAPGEQDGGLIGQNLTASNMNLSVMAGVPLAAITNPSQVFAFGDTDDAGFLTLTIDSILYWEDSFAPQLLATSGLQHGGRFNMAFADGHAKGIAWRAGIMWGAPDPSDGGRDPTDLRGLFAVPRSSSYFADWCADPDATINTEIGAMPCGQVAGAYLAYDHTWLPD